MPQQRIPRGIAGRGRRPRPYGDRRPIGEAPGPGAGTALRAYESRRLPATTRSVSGTDRLVREVHDRPSGREAVGPPFNQ